MSLITALTKQEWTQYHAIIVWLHLHELVDVQAIPPESMEAIDKTIQAMDRLLEEMGDTHATTKG